MHTPSVVDESAEGSRPKTCIPACRVSFVVSALACVLRYKGRGLFLSPINAALVKGKWKVFSHGPSGDKLPSYGEALRLSHSYDSLEDLFDPRRRTDASDPAAQYSAIIDQELDR